MSPRAAARLETLGFTKVFDYVGGKRDLLTAALPKAGRSAAAPIAGDALRSGDIICHLGDRLGDVVERVPVVWGHSCIVVGGHHFVVGIIPNKSLEGNPKAPVEDIMQLSPPTVSQDTPLEMVVETLRDGYINNTLVTDPEGRLLGVVYLEDAERKLAEHNDV